jgi:hypothetical protein
MLPIRQYRSSSKRVTPSARQIDLRQSATFYHECNKCGSGSDVIRPCSAYARDAGKAVVMTGKPTDETVGFDCTICDCLTFVPYSPSKIPDHDRFTFYKIAPDA